MRRTWVAGVLAIGFVLHASPKGGSAEADREAMERLQLRLGATRGVGGAPAPTVAAQVVVDPRAEDLAFRLRATGVAQRLAAVRGAVAAQAVPGAVVAGPGGALGVAPRTLALQRLAQQVGPGLELHWRSENGTVRQIRGAVLARPAAVAKANPRDEQESTARRFLRDQAALLGVADPEAEFELERNEPDGLGGRNLRFRQVYQGVPVWPATLLLHLDARGAVVLVEGAYIPTPVGVPLLPTVNAEDAVLRARASVPAGMRGQTDGAVLVIHAPLDAAPQLAWRLDLNIGLSQAWRFLVSALDGRILQRSSRILDANVAGRGVDLSGVTRNLNVWNGNGRHYLIDASKPMYKAGSDPVRDPQGVIVIGDAELRKIDQLQGSDVALITATDPNQWALADGVSAAFNFSETFDYFAQAHGRNSLDGKGGTITAIVRVGEYDNASWHGNLRIMLFGNVQPYANALDVVGHELTHGVIENSAGLVYENQSGALNESFADIFGELVEARVVGAPDWKLGTKLARVFRDFVNPGSLTIQGLNRPYPSKMSEFVELPNTNEADHGGVHINSSIFNHAFWLVAAGLPGGGIGLVDAERVFYRCLTQHLQPQSQFIDARLGCIAAAEALFGAGSTQVRKVTEAFDAVEIFAAPQTPPPPTVPVVQGPDSSLFLTADPFFGDLLLARREAAQGDNAGGSLFSDTVTLSRPAVSGDGTYALFVSADHDVCIAETADPSGGQCLGFSGLVHSVAVSPDGKLGAFVLQDAFTGQPDNRISVIDLALGTSKSFDLLAPAVDGVPVDAVLYADAMTFTTDSQVLIYDAISRLRFGTGPTVERWSVYALNLATSKMSIVIPPIEGVDTGNPTMGRTGNRYIALDAQVEATGNSVVLVMDLFSGQAAEVGVVDRGLGYPTFTGDESSVLYAQRDVTAFSTGFSIVRQGVGTDRLSLRGQPEWWIQDARLATIYRRGAFTGSNQAPTVEVTSPAAGAVLSPGVPATFAVQASDADGSISVVEFYDGDDLLGTDQGAPFSISWTPGASGQHRLIARAIDNLGAVSDSAPVLVSVGGGNPGTGPKLGVTRLPTGAMRLVVRGAAGAYVISMSTNLREWTDIYPVTVGAAGEGTVDDAGGPANNRTLFYRARRE